ncbi:hypothetical protein HDZ31DRAFT_35651 [Schizophyllum fasciatum]
MPAKTMVERRSGATKRARMGRATRNRKGCLCFDPQAPDAISNCAHRCRRDELVYKEHSMPLQVVYRHLFETPRDDAELRFPNKTPAESRCILWAICTHPLIDAKRTNPSMLGSLAELFYHYEIEPLQHWAIDALQELTSPPSLLLQTCSSPTMTYLSRVALLYRLKPWYQHILKHWHDRLLHPGKHPLPPEDAITFGAQTGELGLQATGCYAYLLRHLPRIAADAPARRIRAAPPLAPAMHRHVLAGYLSLSTAARRLRDAPPAFARADDCAAEEHWKCERAWARRWVAAGGAGMGLDLVGGLAAAHEALRRDARLARQMHDGCREAAVAALKKARVDAVGHLVHHFDL